MNFEIEELEAIGYRLDRTRNMARCLLMACDSEDIEKPDREALGCIAGLILVDVMEIRDAVAVLGGCRRDRAEGERTMTSQGGSALRALAAEYETAVRASGAYQGSEEQLAAVVDEECAIARRIALLPAMTLADLAIKAAVALRETGTNKFKIGEPVDCDALLQMFDDQDRPDLEGLINVSIALDVMRMSGSASVFGEALT